MDLEEAVAAARRGESEGYEYLYTHTYQEKYPIALHYMKNKEDAQDVMHDSYLKAWAHIGELEDPKKFSPWLSQIVANTSKNMLKKRKHTISIETMVYETEDGIEYGFDKESDDESWQPEAAYVREEAHGEFVKLLDSLPEAQRTCVKMYYIDGLKAREIAEKLDIPLPTVKSRLNYARNHLKKNLKK